MRGIEQVLGARIAFVELTLADGRTLEYREFGDPDGVPVVVLPGTPATASNAALVSDAAVAAGARLVAVSRPGYGASSTSPPGLASTARDVVELIDALGLDRVGVHGISGGGPFAIALAAVAAAARHPRGGQRRPEPRSGGRRARRGGGAVRGRGRAEPRRVQGTSLPDRATPGELPRSPPRQVRGLRRRHAPRRPAPGRLRPRQPVVVRVLGLRPGERRPSRAAGLRPQRPDGAPDARRVAPREAAQLGPVTHATADTGTSPSVWLPRRTST